MRETQQDSIIESRLETIERLSSVKKPDWVTEEVQLIHQTYSELRNHILTNKTKWNYFEYCLRFSHHYYNTSVLLYSYFEKHKTNLDIIRIYLDKCMSQLHSIRSSEKSSKTSELFIKATVFKKAIDKIYINLESKLNSVESTNAGRIAQAKLLINFGHVDYENFDFFAVDLSTFRTHVLGILLINFVSDVEEMLTLNVDKDHYSKSNICRFLARVYQICGQQNLHDDYMKRASKQITLAFSILGEEDTSPKTREMVRNTIKEQVLHFYKDLVDIYNVIKQEYNKELSNLDCTYVERKFIKYCTQGFMQELHETLEKMSKSKNNKVFLKLLSNMKEIKTLADFQDSFTIGGFYKLLSDHQAILKPEQLKIIIKNFKKDIWDTISLKFSAAQKELDVLKQLITFLRSVTNCRSIISQLQLTEFCSKTVSVHTFLTNILNLIEPHSTELITLKSLTEEIKDQTTLFFMDKFVEILYSYSFPPLPEINGDTMILRGKLVIMSEVMTQVLKKKSDAIKELRILEADVVFIDENLENQHWAGLNVLLVSKTVHVQEKRVWNLSGINAKNYPSKADDGVNPGDNGTNGENGLSGESGGNVYIRCINMINSENLTILSNGGLGGTGQTGGNGAKGVDGKGIKLSEFENFISPPEPSYDITTKLVKIASLLVNPITVVFDLRRELEILHRDRYLPNIPLPKISQAVKLFDITWSKAQFRLNVWNTGPSYFTGSTEDQCNITYSYYPHYMPSKQEVSALYKGTLAQIGGQGGNGGLEGPGGYPGDIDIKCRHPIEVSYEKESGGKGKKGMNGKNGHPGRNGWDMGFAFVNGWFSSTRKIIGRNQDCNLTIKYHDSRKDNDFVYCPYTNNYIEIQSGSSKTNVYDRNHLRQQNQEDQQQEKVTRSKAISRSVIAKEEENISNDVVDELVDLALDLEDLKEHALEEIVEGDEKKETEMTNFQVQRQAVFDDSGLLKKRKLLRKRQNHVKHKSSSLYVSNVIESPTNIQLWLELKSIVIDIPDLTKLFNLLFSNKSELSNNFASIYNILLSKYKIAICQQIHETKKLPEVEVYFDAEPIENYLVIESNSREFTNDDLGILQEYFRPGHEKLFPGLQKYLENIDIGLIIYPLKFFIMEKSYSDSSFKFNSKSLLEKLNELESRLERLIKCYLVAYEKDNTSSILLAIERRKDEIIEKFKDETDFKIILTQFVDYVEKVGISSTAVRELLSCAFDVNIKIYIINHNKELILYHSHNPTSKNVLYLFLENDQFVECRIDDKYMNLITERKKLSKNYSDILSYVNEFVCKKEFDDFLNNFEHFNGYESKNSIYLAYDKLSNDDLIAKICAYFPSDDFSTIKPVLNKIKSDIIQNKNILLSLLQRFDTDGVHISIYELIFITSSILRSFTKQNVNLEMYEWILSIKPQSTWLNDIYYLELENYFKKSLRSTTIPGYLTTVKQKDIILLMDIKLHEATDSINLKCISTCLEVLSEIEVDEEILRSLPLSKWQYTLREQLLEYRLCCITEWESNDQLQKVLYYINCLESNIGREIINKLLGVLDAHEDEITSNILTDIFSLLYVQEWSLNDELLNKLSTYGIKYINKELGHNQCKMEEERSLETLLKLIETNSNTSSKIKHVLKSFQQHPILMLTSIKQPYSKDHIKAWSEQFKQNINGLNKKAKKIYFDQHTNEILTMIIHAVRLRKGFMLRTTQRLAILLMLSHNHNTLSQISTGEGKSLIVVAVSIFKALCGEKVDIITSSSVLAVRDATIHKDIFDLFNISVSHNCFDALDKRRDAYSACQVIFGDLSCFQRDYLLDRFYQMNILGDRTFDILIVDEVDSMFLDKGNNTLYLSHEIPGLDKLESVYQFLWKRICMSAGKKIENFEMHLKQEVQFDLYGTMYVDDLESYLGITKPDSIAIYNFLKGINVIDQNHRVLKEINYDDAGNVSEQYQAQIHKIRYIINKILKRNREIRIPKCLYKFVEHHIDIWIKNGLLAIVMEEGIDYVVDVDRTQTKADINPNITIIDKGTGTDQSNSQWEEALHQFLQLKHGCKVTPQSLKAVFISNVSYFKQYAKLFGLTGTLGSQIERDLLKELYKVQFVNVPTAKPKKFIEQEPLLCCTQTDWSFRIVNRTKELTGANRSVLIICETIKEVNTVAKAFQQSNIPYKKIYKREYEECLLAQGKEELDGGSVIIATNLAGRGTDIKITDNLNKNGGLHVLLTYLPSNARIEQQAFGRAARSGCNGSGQLIIIGYGSFLDKREQREAEERQRIADMKTLFDTTIQVEEKFFEGFSKVYKKCNSSLLTEKKLKVIASQRLLDRWAFWIDEYGAKLSDSTTDNKFDEFKKEIIDSFSKWNKWTQDPIQLNKVGLNFIKQKSYKNAIQVFDTVIKLEPLFSEAAHYYKAAALVQSLDFEKRPFKGKDKTNYSIFLKELKMAEKLFESHKDACMESSAFIQNLKQNMTNSFITIDAYRKQQETMITLYDLYIRSIHDIVGHQVNKGSFICQEIKQDNSETIYETFLEESVLKQSQIVKASIEDTEEVSTNFGISLDVLSNFLKSYEGKNIEEQEFLKYLKYNIKMPSLEECWEILVNEQKLVNEIRFIIIQKSKLTTVQENSLSRIKQAQININTSQGKYVFMKQYINSDIEDPLIFKENILNNSINRDLYNSLKKENILMFNRIAELSENNISKQISLYDHISVNNLTSDKIIQTEAENILNTLTEKKFLINNSSNLYNLVSEYDENKLPMIPAYDQALSQILRINFAYRIALQNLQNELKNNQQDQVYVKLISEPHVSLMWELFGKKIIQPVSVDNHTSNCIDNILEAYGKNDHETKSIKNYVKGILKKFAGSLKSFDTPNFNLVYIIEYMEGLQVSPLQELNTFLTNSLDFILKTEEKKYTWKMICSTIFVMVLGLLELAAGLAIQLFFAGALSHLGNWLIDEGLSDLQYAASCWWTGYFDWNDYGRYKLQSVIQSFVMMCGSAIFSTGFSYSRFGNKLAMSGIIGQGGKEVAKMTGKQLIKEVGGKAVAKEFGKQFIIKVGEGLAKGLLNESINSLVDSYLQNLCNQLANTLVQDIETAVNNHGIGNTLYECYKILGPKETKERIVHFTEKSFSQPTINNCIIAKALTITSGISTVCSEAAKRGKNMTYAQYVQYLAKVLQYSQYASHLVDIVASVGRMLDKVDKELKEDIRAAKQRGVKNKSYKDQDIQAFKIDVINQWRNMLKENANTIFTERIAKPVLQNCALELAKKGTDGLKKLHNFTRNKYHKHIFDTTKRKKNTALQNQSLSEETKKQIIETYHETLAELKTKIRDPKLYAEIVMEKGHMDAVCLKATSCILDRFRGNDSRPVKLTVETDRGATVEYYTSGSGECREINLKLLENHFTNANADIAPNSTDYECLYRSLTHEFPELRQLSMDEFRSHISNEIKTNCEIIKDVKYGKHAFAIRRKIYGGHRDEAIATDKLRTNLMKGEYFFSQSSVSEKTAKRDKEPGGIHLAELADSIKDNFDEKKRINVVEREDGKYVFLDNRRVVAASTINNPEVNILVRVFKFDEVLPNELHHQYGANITAGEAAENRIRRGSLEDRKKPNSPKPYSPEEVRIRKNNEESTVTIEKKKEFYRRAREIKYNIYTRTRSTDRRRG